MLLTFVPLTVFASSGNTYYIDSISGSDSASGTSERGAWKTTANIASLNLNAGDKVLFRREGVYDCTLTLTCSGTKENPIIISAYGEGERPLLRTNERNAVLKLFDCDYVTVSDFEITAHNGGGIWVDARAKNSCGVTIENIIFHDMQNYKVRTRDNFSEGPISGRAAVVVRRYGNEITGNNIGCYGGDGTDAEYQKESLSDKLHRNATDVCNTVVIIIKNEIKRLIKKVIKYFENNF